MNRLETAKEQKYTFKSNSKKLQNGESQL